MSAPAKTLARTPTASDGRAHPVGTCPCEGTVMLGSSVTPEVTEAPPTADPCRALQSSQLTGSKQPDPGELRHHSRTAMFLSRRVGDAIGTTRVAMSPPCAGDLRGHRAHLHAVCPFTGALSGWPDFLLSIKIYFLSFSVVLK